LPVSYGIIGLKGYGKSALLRQLATILADHPRLVKWAQEFNWGDVPVPTVIPVYLDCSGYDGASVLLRIYIAIGAVLQEHQQAVIAPSQAGKKVPAKRAFVEPTDTTVALDLANLAKRALDSAAERTHKLSPAIVLLLDDFDTAYSTISGEDEQTLRRFLPSVPVVVATEQPWEHLKRDNLIGSPLFRYVEQRIRIEPFSWHEAQELHNTTSWRNTQALDEEMFRLAFELSGGVPLLLIAISKAFDEMRMAGEALYSVQTNSKLYDQLALRLLTAYGLKDCCMQWWEELTETEQEVLSQLTLPNSTDQKMQASAIERLRQWHLVREEEGRYRIGPLLLADYIRLLEPPAPTRRKRGTVDERLLVYLQAHPTVLCTYEELLHHVWGDESLEGRRVDNAVMRLRKRLGRDVIETIYGKGIRYTKPTSGSQTS
jgi:hypothetical protein